jgi:hypothetical protein
MEHMSMLLYRRAAKDLETAENKRLFLRSLR